MASTEINKIIEIQQIGQSSASQDLRKLDIFNGI